MDSSHFHLIVNHMPTAFGFVALLVMLIGFIGKSAPVKKVSLGLIVLTGIAGGTAYFTGVSADIYDESFSQHKSLRAHETLGKTTWIVSLVGGVVALAGLAVSRRMQEVPGPLMLVALLLLLATFFLSVKTANQGGKLFHPETRDDALTKILNPD